jgi:aminoglycoside phosphotransferase (APT) family kinase protein
VRIHPFVLAECHSDPVIDEALLRVLSAFAGSAQTFAQRPTPITGGFWAAIYGFELHDPPADLRGRLVLRIMPNPEVGRRETIVQRGVAEQGYPTPRVVLDGVDAPLGGAFMVMERVEGVQLLAGLGLGGALLRLPKTVRRVARQLSTATLQLHAIDPQPIADALRSGGVDIAALGVAARFGEIRDALPVPGAGFEALLAWLEAHRPALTPAVVCHGDIHPFNMLVTDDESYNMLDWTNGNLCRREYDIGFTAALLNCAPIAVPRIAEPALRGVTGALARRFVDAYRRSVPINLEVVDWFEALQYGRCLAAVATSPIGDPIIGPKHPFRLSAPAMVRQLQIITDVTIKLPL